MHTTGVSGCSENKFQEVKVPSRERPLCDCPSRAAGKDKAFFEVVASLDGPPHAEDFTCRPCQVKRASL